MSDEPLFAGYDPPAEPVEKLSPDRRRTMRQRTNIANGEHPLTHGRLHPQASRDASPDDTWRSPFTCGTCVHRGPGGGRSYPKCLLPASNGNRIYVTGGAATDCRAWWPACESYEPTEGTTT